MSDDEKPPRVVKVKPGTATHPGVLAVLPEDAKINSVGEVVKYALGQKDLTADSVRLAERVKVEMLKDYGMTINGQVVQGNEKIGDNYFVEKRSNEGVPYLEMEVVVAAKQEGGYSGLVSRL